jgi:T-complex protein 1 subunit delta
MSPINVVTELRNRHSKNELYAGIGVRKGEVTDMKEERVLQPALVTQSALTLAT